jgi:ankyrin repeat protein
MPPPSKQDEVNVPLATAIKEGDVATAENLIKAGADVNSYMDRATPLFFAAVLNDRAMARMLVAHGADTANALFTAVYQNEFPNPVRTAALLLDLGADPYMRINRTTNLEAAADGRNMRVLEMLLARVHAPHTPRESQALHNALTTGLDWAAIQGDSVAVEFLLRRLPSLPRRDAAKARLACMNHQLMAACLYGELAKVQRLVTHGADVNFRCTEVLPYKDWTTVRYDLDGDPGATSPLYAASKAGSLPIMKYLIAHGACVDPVIPGKDDVPLIAALDPLTKGNSIAPAMLLVRSGANVNAANRVGKTPLMSAAFDNPTIAATLLSHGARANTQDPGGRTALFNACAAQQLSIAKLLIAHGASTNINCYAGSLGIISPLEIASFESEGGSKRDPMTRRALIKLLLKHGAHRRQ